MLKKEVKDILDNLQKLNVNELNEVLIETQLLISNNLHRFNELIEALENTLIDIQTEFPNATIPLVETPEKHINIMDYIVPEDFLDLCKMGE